MKIKKYFFRKLKEFTLLHQDKIREFYRKNFTSKEYYRFNSFLFSMILQSLGILNYENDEVSGESNFLTNYLSSLEKESPVIFDVGAHIGKYSQKCIDINSNVKVYSFEPNPNTFKKLEKNIADKNVLIFNFGFHDKETETVIYDSGQFDGSQHASIYKDVIEDLHKYNDCIESKIKLEKIDDFVEKNNVHYIDLLKIDTEGNEISVLKGAKKILSENKIRCIQIEFNSMNIISRTFLKDFIDLLEGYQFYRLLPEGAIRVDYNPLEFELFAFQNLIALKKGDKIKGVTC